MEVERNVFAFVLVATASSVTLDWLRCPVAARIISFSTLATAWLVYLSNQQQVKAIIAALIVHSIAEYVRKPSSSEEKSVYWLLLFSRVMLWGMTFTIMPMSPSVEDAWIQAPWVMLATTVYYEMVEVSLLVYSNQARITYSVANRLTVWVLAASIGLLQASRLLTIVANLLDLCQIHPFHLVVALGLWIYKDLHTPVVASPLSSSEEDSELEATETRSGSGYRSSIDESRTRLSPSDVATRLVFEGSMEEAIEEVHVSKPIDGS